MARPTATVLNFIAIERNYALSLVGEGEVSGCIGALR